MSPLRSRKPHRLNAAASAASSNTATREPSAAAAAAASEKAAPSTSTSSLVYTSYESNSFYVQFPKTGGHAEGGCSRQRLLLVPIQHCTAV